MHSQGKALMSHIEHMAASVRYVGYGGQPRGFQMVSAVQAVQRHLALGVAIDVDNE
jgi:hypothetical protein